MKIERRHYRGPVFNLHLQGKSKEDDLFWIEQASGVVSHNCFPKDSNAFIEFAKSVGVDPSILTAAWDYNLKVRQDQDWMRIVGAVSEQ